jgi:TPR repeat protein
LTWLAVCLAPLWVALAADDFDAALEALRAGEVLAARAQMQVLAEQGEPRAQDVLAAMLLKGVGGPADVPAAMGWYCMLAHHPGGGRATVNALWRLAEYFRTGGGQPGRAYQDGDPAQENPLKALFWFEVMAQQQRHYAEVLPQGVRLGRIGAGRVRDLLLDAADASACLALP